MTLLRNYWIVLLTFLMYAEGEQKQPTVFISILVRNKAHTLPYFLTQLENLEYPKDRIVLHIRSHHNQDNSLEVLERWLNKTLPLKEYHNIIKEFYPCEMPCLMEDEQSPVGWSDEKFSHIMKIRQQSLTLARFYWADYFWSLDSDVILTDSRTLDFLVERNHTLVAPLLSSIGRYSNFWGGMSESYYYQRTPEYSDILDRKETGCFNVPMIHSAVLLNLRTPESDLISYTPENIHDYPGPHDDIIVFALSASLNNIPLHVCNQLGFGVIMLPLEDEQDLSEDLTILQYTLLEASVLAPPIIPLPIFQDLLPTPKKLTKHGLDEIYMINLDRRKDRRDRMDFNFQMLGVKARPHPAVDGKDLTDDYLEEQGITMLPGFSEPYHGRPLKLGEIGCFMSHYTLWKDIVEQNHDIALIFEDDIRFEPYFTSKLDALLKELKERRDDWDLVFLGRKRTKSADEPWLSGSQQLVHVDYTYWTLSYILSKAGAAKLIDAEPLSKMLPVDEYIPIMYDKHPNTTWQSFFPNRNLKALSAEPLLVYPTHYVGMEGYVSDTEDTTIINIDNEQCTDGAHCIKDEL